MGYWNKRKKETDGKIDEKSLLEMIRDLVVDENRRDIDKTRAIESGDFSLYHIQELTFEDDSPRKEALENVLGSLKIDGVMFLYLILGDREKVSFYFGIVKDMYYSKELEIDVDDIAKNILKPSIEGNFRGSKIENLKKDSKNDILEKISSFQRFAKIRGIPTTNDDKEEFQGIDRLVDVMSGDEFAVMILADPLSSTEITNIEQSLYEVYDKLNPFQKRSIQEGHTQGETKGSSNSENTSNNTTKGDNNSIAITDGENHGTNTSTTSGSSSGGSSNSTNKSGTEGRSDGTNHSETKTTGKSVSVSNTVGKSTSSNNSSQNSKSQSTTLEYSNKDIQNWIKYIDETLLKRLSYGKNKGLYYSNVFLLSNTKGTLIKLGNTFCSLFSGIEDTKAPLEFINISNTEDKSNLFEIETIKNLQLPISHYKLSENEKLRKILLARSHTQKVSSWLSTKELSVMAGLPQKEIVGLRLKEEVEFGLNTKTSIKNSNKLLLGSLVKSGNILDIDVNIDKENLDKHTFIAGVTGSGKTTTCQRILNSSQLPFMVIEPAKTEYRVLTKEIDDILIFTLGNDTVAPFRLNPFEFFPHENITSRVDMIKASIEASFDMEAAIPQIIEASIYKCYENYGWDISTSKNTKFDNPFADGVYAFPTLSDLINVSEEVVEEQGFDDRLKNDYIGSIKARLQGLLIGAKGMMLNTSRSIDFKDLARRNVILELEEIRNPSEKSLVMGFVLANLNEAIKANYEEDKNNNKQFKHITLIEEAHRLLSRYEAGDSLNKKQGVETFADMLAEVRKYGEALIIVDQIPNKLTSEVLKNTNTKIIHKLFAKDDKEAVGNTMALDDEQKDFLSTLETGRAILTSQGFSKPLQVQIKELISTTNEKSVDKKYIRNICMKYYQKNHKKGLIKGLEHYKGEISIKLIESFMEKELYHNWKNMIKTKEIKLSLYLNEYELQNNLNFIQEYIISNFYKESSDLSLSEIREKLKSYLDKCISGNDKIDLETINYFTNNKNLI